MADLPVRFEFRDRDVGVPELDPDDRNAGATGHADIRTGIAHHDRGGDLTARARNRLPQDDGSGFETPNVSAPQIAANRGLSSSRSSSSFDSHSSLLVQTAKRYPRRQLSSAPPALRRPRMVGDMGRIIIDEIAGQPGDVGASWRAIYLQAALDQLAGAGPIMLRAEATDRWQALAIQHVIERVDQFGRRVHERAVEIEYDSAGGVVENRYRAPGHASRERLKSREGGRAGICRQDGVCNGRGQWIGLALGGAFAQAGMKVMLADIEAEALAAPSKAVQAFGPDVRRVACDVADPASVDRAAHASFEALEKLHVVCNNAGVAAGGVIDRSRPIIGGGSSTLI